MYGISQRIERQATGQHHSGDELWRGDKRVCVRVGVVASGEIAIVRGDDGVFGVFGHVLTIPLADARAARVGKHHAADLLQRRGNAVAGDSGANL